MTLQKNIILTAENRTSEEVATPQILRESSSLRVLGMAAASLDRLSPMVLFYAGVPRSVSLYDIIGWLRLVSLVWWALVRVCQGLSRFRASGFPTAIVLGKYLSKKYLKNH